MRDPQSKWHLPTALYPSARFAPYAEGPLYVVSQVRRRKGVVEGDWGWGMFICLVDYVGRVWGMYVSRTW